MGKIVKLDTTEKLLLIEKIEDSITETLVNLELKKRLDRYERGETVFYSWADVKSELNSPL